MRSPRVLLLFAVFGLAASLIGASLLLGSTARALPPAGTDILALEAQVTVTSLLGTETVMLNGTVTIQRSDPQLEGGVEVVDTEIVALDLLGTSLTGTVSVTESASLTSSGQIRSLQSPPDQFPASSFFDAFIEVTVPAAPSPTIMRHNEVPLHLVPMSGGSEVPLAEWPPIGVTYQAEPDPCAPLLPQLPAELCVTSLSIVFGEVQPTPTITPTLTPEITPTPTPELPQTLSVASGGPSGLPPASLLGLTAGGGSSPLPPPPVAVSGNDNFADAWTIPLAPFIGQQSTVGTTTEAGEPLFLPDCPTFAISIGGTVWYRITPSSSGTIDADTIGSTFDTVLAAHTGDAVGELTQVTCKDDTPGLSLRSRISFPATAGTTYYLQVGGFGTSVGDITLNVSFSGVGLDQAPLVRIACLDLGLTAEGCDAAAGEQDDVDALSYGSDFSEGDVAIAFSVAPGSSGLPGTAVAGQAACDPAQPQADRFSTSLDGSNALDFDGDGLNTDCPTAEAFGLMERPTSDDMDTLNEQPPGFVDPDDDGSPDEVIFFSLAAGSPSLETQDRSAADVLWTIAGFQPGVYASADALGLQSEDDIDALCMLNEDDFIYEAGADAIAFSLALGSPTLAALGASPADVLGAGPRLLFSASDLGLGEDDDLNAMACFAAALPPPPPPTPTPTPTPTATPTATTTMIPTATPVGGPGPIAGPSTGDKGFAIDAPGVPASALGALGLAVFALFGWALPRLRRR